MSLHLEGFLKLASQNQLDPSPPVSHLPGFLVVWFLVTPASVPAVSPYLWSMQEYDDNSVSAAWSDPS
jgi:hypothetical protein